MDSADDMGLGKTLTMIALILAKKKTEKEEKEKKEKEKLETWLTKTGKKNIYLYFLLFPQKLQPSEPSDFLLLIVTQCIKVT